MPTSSESHPAHEEPRPARKVAGGFYRILVRHHFDIIDQGHVQYRWYEAVSNPLDLVKSRFLPEKSSGVPGFSATPGF